MLERTFLQYLRYFGIRAVVTTLAIAALVGCSDNDDPQEPVFRVGVTTEVSVTPATVRVGDSISIEISVYNDTSELLEIDFTTTAQFSVRILNSSEVIAWYPGIASPAMSRLRIPPGEMHSFTTSKIIDAGSNGWMFPWTEGVTEIAPGTYTIVGGIRHHQEEYPWGEAQFRVVE